MTRVWILLIAIIGQLIFGASCKVHHGIQVIDGFTAVRIGKQIWMLENLDVDTFRNGDAILEAKTSEEWFIAGKNRQPAWCYYKNNEKIGSKYGKMYNWYAAADPRGLAPDGWRVPTAEDWEQLSHYLGGDEIAGQKMKSRVGWKRFGHGTNSSGFFGLPGGSRSYMLREGYGIFRYLRKYGMWWSVTRKDNEVVELASYCVIGYNGDYLDRGATSLEHGIYVRCLK